jgi:hypothetical protein
MSGRRIAAVLAAVSVVSVAVLAAPMAAVAQTTTPHAQVTTLNSAPVTGASKNGKKFSGRFTIERFVTKNGKTYAVGTLTGKLGHRTIKRSNVRMPVAVNHGLAGVAAACPIVHLVLGPLNLNLLGLKVHLNQLVLDVTAQSGPGNLLGNLLCSVAGLLNGPSVLGNQTSGLLNIFQQLLSSPGLLNL